MNQIRVVIAEDSEPYLKGIAEGVGKQDQIEVVGYARNGLEVLEVVKLAQPDVVLMDIRMPRMDGIEATKIIREKYPSVRVLALTGYNERFYVNAMLQAGAAGYIDKHTVYEQIGFYIRNCCHGRFYYSGDVSGNISEWIKHNPDEMFSDKELKIMQLSCEEKSMDEIAASFFRSKSTVEKWKSSLMKKLGVNTTEGLVRYAAQHGYNKPLE